MKNKKAAAWIVVAVLAVIAIAVYIGRCIQDHKVNGVPYEEATTLMDSGDYPGAIEKFKEVEDRDYQATRALQRVCEAHQYYEDGKIDDAWNAVRFLDDLYDTSSITSEQRQEIKAFQDKLEVEVVPYNERKAEEERQERMRRIREGVPYVGMSESYISMTSLGAPSSDVRHNYECISGEQYLANLYDYKENGHTIFTARCVQGKVIQVWDNRGQDTSRPAYRPSTSSKSDDDDPYDVNGYHHAEDFYYDHYDDFFDYYDAEDYFNEHKD